MNKVNYFGFKMVTDKMAISDPTAFEPQTYSTPKGDWAAIVSYTPHNRIQSVRVQHKTFKGERTAPINSYKKHRNMFNVLRLLAYGVLHTSMGY